MSSSTRAKLSKRTDLLAFLVEASQAVSACEVDLDKLMRLLARLTREVVDCEIFTVLLRLEDEALLQVRYTDGLPEDIVSSVQVPFGQGITGAAAEQRRSVLANDVTKDPRYIPTLENVRSELATPLIARGRTVGVIDLESSKEGAFSQSQRHILELLASRVALAVDNALLFAHTRRQYSTLKTLLSLSQNFSTILHLDQLMPAVATVLRTLIDYDSYSIYLLPPDGNRLEHFTSFRHDSRIRLDSAPLNSGIIGAAARRRRPVLVADTLADPRRPATREGVRSEVAVPLTLKDRVVGVLSLESGKPRFFNKHHVETLQTLASQLAAAIENARLYDQTARDGEKMRHDLTAARRIQRDLLLPRPPAFPGVEVAAHNRPFLAVSGDFYDFYAHDTASLGVLVGDVSGKGAAAALYGALVSGLFRSLDREEHTPGERLGEVNQALAERQNDPSTFATAAYLRWTPGSGDLVLANSGLPMPIVVTSKSADELPAIGIPLGMFPGTQYDEVRLELRSGDLVVVVSDGVLECWDASGEEYGRERLKEVVGRCGACSAEEAMRRIAADLQRHSRGAEAADDQTLVVLKIK